MSNASLRFAALLIIVSATANADGKPGGGTSPVQGVAANSFGPRVSLPCVGPAASDVYARRHTIKNFTTHPIPAGTIVHWDASDKGSGNVTLTSALAPNDGIDVDAPGHTSGYTCTASFDPGLPDYAVRSVAWTGPSTAVVVAENRNPWAGGVATTLRVKAMSCASATPIATTDVAVSALVGNGTQMIYAEGLPKAKADYLLATANATGSAAESNRTNNDLKSPDWQLHCVPK